MSQYHSIREDVLQKIESSLPEIRELFGIETLGVFGSVSRGEDTVESDVDILYRFQEGRGRLREFVGLAEYLEELFGRKVELISLDYVDIQIKSSVREDAVLYGENPVIA